MRSNSLVAAALLTLTAAAGAQQYSFEEVAAGLRHQDPATRLRAIQILRDADYGEAAAPIAEVLGDPDDRVQLAALQAERALFTERPVSHRRRVGFIIERRVNTAAGDAAAEGRLALKARRIPAEVLSGLALTLTDDNPRVRVEAIGLAALLGPVACDARAKPGAPRANDAGREAQLCAQLGNVLIENINSKEAPVRRAAMLALGQLRYLQAVQALTDQFGYYQTGPDAQAAFEALAGIGHPSSASIFEQGLTSSSAEWRRLAVEGLARVGDSSALPQLQQMAGSERSNGVLLALHYAGIRLGAPGASPAEIVASLNSAGLRPAALTYLIDLAPSMAPAIADALTNPDEGIRRLAADVLGFSADPAVVPALERALNDPDPAVSAAARRAIDRIALR